MLDADMNYSLNQNTFAKKEEEKTSVGQKRAYCPPIKFQKFLAHNKEVQDRKFQKFQRKKEEKEK